MKRVICVIIYKITNNINGKIYVGQTCRSLEDRMAEHVRHSTIVVDKAIQKYGADNFTVERIDVACDIDELNQKEQFWIQHYDCMVPNGYNQCVGGDNTVGFHHRSESRQRMSNKKKSQYMGEGNPFFGKRHSDVSRKKMSDARKGLAHLTDEQVRNLRMSHHTVKVRNVETGEVFSSVKEAATAYDLKDTHITRVCKGKRKTTGGFHWCYEEP